MTSRIKIQNASSVTFKIEVRIESKFNLELMFIWLSVQRHFNRKTCFIQNRAYFCDCDFLNCTQVELALWSLFLAGWKVFVSWRSSKQFGHRQWESLCELCGCCCNWHSKLCHARWHVERSIDFGNQLCDFCDSCCIWSSKLCHSRQDAASGFVLFGLVEVMTVLQAKLLTGYRKRNRILLLF